MSGEAFDRQVQEAQRRLEELTRRAGRLAADQPLLGDSLGELTIALQELHVAAEELQQQNETLAATRQLVEAERRHYQELFDLAPSGYLVTDPEGVIREANRAVATLLDVRQDFLVGKPLLVFVAETAHQRFHERLIRLQADPHTAEGWEIPLQPRNGTPFPTAITVSPVRDATDRPTGLRWLVRDFSQHKRAEVALRGAHDDLEVRVRERTADLQQANEALRASLLEQQRTAEALRGSQAQLAGTIGSAMDAIITIDDEQRILVFNAAAERIFRCAAAQVTGQSIDRFIPERFRRPHREHIQAFGQSNISKRTMGSLGSVVGLRADGEEFPVEASISQVEVAGRKLFTVILRDITERKQAEEVLQSEKLLRNVLEALPVGVWVTDRQGHVISGNPAGRHIWAGAKPVDTQQPGEHKGWWVATGKLIAPEEWAAARAITRGDTTLDEEVEIECFDGMHKIILNSAVPIRNARQEIVGAIVVNQDISERKRVEGALRESRTQLAGIIDSAMEAIITIDENRCILVFNTAAERMFRVSAAEVMGTPIDRFVPERIRPAHREGMRFFDKSRLAKRWIGVLGAATGLRADGEEFPIEAALSQVAVGGQKLYTVILRDVTERKRAEERLQSSREQLRALAARLESVREEERSRIAREIHDELGQALTALKIDLARVAGGLPADQTVLREETRAMLALIDATIRSVRRIATELRPGVLDDLGLVAAIEWQAQEFQTRTGITCEFATDRGDLALDPEVGTAMFRICQETLTNVARHAEATQVTIGLREEAGSLSLTVADNGRGITDQDLANRTSLGLLGIRERALLLGGQVAILGRPGEGTKITVQIPLKLSDLQGNNGSGRKPDCMLGGAP